ncbi:hypothetical protein [Streptomyces humi]
MRPSVRFMQWSCTVSNFCTHLRQAYSGVSSRSRVLDLILSRPRTRTRPRTRPGTAYDTPAPAYDTPALSPATLS